MNYKLLDLKRENFTSNEFYSSKSAQRKKIDNEPKEQATLKNLYLLADKMQIMRYIIDKPMIVTSGYRSKALNETLSGAAPDSYHMHGLAADFYVIGESPLNTVKFFKNKDFQCDKMIASYYWNWRKRRWTKWVHVQFKNNEHENDNKYLLERLRNGKAKFSTIY